MEIAFIVTGLVVGLLIGLLIGRSKSSGLQARLDMLQEERERQTASMESERNELKAHYESALKQAEEKAETILNDNLTRQKEHYDTLIAGMKENFNAQKEEMKERFHETTEKLLAQVKTATDTMLKERQKEFAENSNQSLGQIVNPLRETIDKMKKAMEENTEKQTSMSGEMRANIENMMRQSMAAKQSADELTRVFKHGTKIQGDWGETVLDELLQAQGLTKGIHYDTQAVIKDASGNTVRTEEGGQMRPDVILHLDQRRELIIDSKVSLTAFMDYVNTDDEDARQVYLKAHIDSIQKHVKELSAKDYSSYIQPPKVKMDYVIMFVPHTGALWTALNAQPDLWRRAMEKNVFIADEQTLFAALRIINLTWTQIVQAQNHEKVYQLANEMLNRVGQFWHEYEAIGAAITKAGKADGGQSINTTANQLIKLGAKQSDKNPIPQLLDVEEIPQIAYPSTPDTNHSSQNQKDS